MWIDVFVYDVKPTFAGQIISGQSYGKLFSPKCLICSVIDTLLLRISPILYAL